MTSEHSMRETRQIEFEKMLSSPEFSCLNYEAIQILREAHTANDERYSNLRQLLKEVESNNITLTSEHTQLITELHMAAEVQESILPTPPYFNNEQCGVGALCKPASIIGGDFFNIIDGKSQQPEKYGRSLIFTIGDAVDHGMPAALTAFGVSILVKGFVNRGIIGDFPAFISEVNFDLLDFKKGFTTMTVASLDINNGLLSWCSAGQERPIVFDPQGNIVDTSRTFIGPPMGVMLDLPLVVEEIWLAPGSTVVFPTDGCREASNNASEPLGLFAFTQMVRERLDLLAQDLCEEVVKAVLNYSEKAQSDDDLTLIAIKYKK